MSCSHTQNNNNTQYQNRIRLMIRLKAMNIKDPFNYIMQAGKRNVVYGLWNGLYFPGSYAVNFIRIHNLSGHNSAFA